MKKYIQLLVGIFFSIVFLYLSYISVGKLDISKMITFRVNYIWMAVSIFSFALTMVFRSLAWSDGLKQSLTFRWAFKGVCVGMGANMVMPFKAGEAIRIGIFGKYAQEQEKEKHSYYKAGINLLLERALDIVILTLLALITLSFVDFGGEMRQRIYFLRNTILIAEVVGIAAFVLIWRFRRYWSDLHPYLKKVVEILQGLTVVKKPKVILKVFAYLMLSWLCIYISTIAAVISVGMGEINIMGVSLVILVLTNIAVLLPAAPGGIGVFQYATVYALGLFAVLGLHAAVLAVLLHFVQYLAILPIAGYYLVSMRKWIFQFMK